MDDKIHEAYATTSIMVLQLPSNIIEQDSN